MIMMIAMPPTMVSVRFILLYWQQELEEVPSPHLQEPAGRKEQSFL